MLIPPPRITTEPELVKAQFENLGELVKNPIFGA